MKKPIVISKKRINNILISLGYLRPELEELLSMFISDEYIKDQVMSTIRSEGKNGFKNLRYYQLKIIEPKFLNSLKKLDNLIDRVKRYENTKDLYDNKFTQARLVNHELNNLYQELDDLTNLIVIVASIIIVEEDYFDRQII